MSVKQRRDNSVAEIISGFIWKEAGERFYLCKSERKWDYSYPIKSVKACCSKPWGSFTDKLVEYNILSHVTWFEMKKRKNVKEKMYIEESSPTFEYFCHLWPFIVNLTEHILCSWSLVSAFLNPCLQNSIEKESRDCCEPLLYFFVWMLVFCGVL